MTLLKTPPSAVPGHPAPEIASVLQTSPLEDASWDKKLAAFPDATCFHTAGWARVLHDSYGYTPCSFATDGPEGFRSLLPLMEVSSRWTGRRGISLPFTDCCDPLLAPGQDERTLLEAAIHHASERSWRYLEFRGGHAFPHSAPAAVRYFAHRLCLRKSEDALWSGLTGAARRAVRKAREEGVEITNGQDEAALKIFYRLHCLTRRRIGVPPQPFHFFDNIRRHLLDPGLATILLASHRGKTVAAAIYLHFGRSVMFKFGASSLDTLHLRANNLLMWEAIRRFAAEGKTDFHMGRNETDNPGLRRYKLAWGTTESELVYHRYCPVLRAFVNGSNPQQHWQHLAFRHIPVPLARIIGSVVYPHMA